jgi:hypothetical protein
MIFPEGEVESSEPLGLKINVVENWFEELKERVPVPWFSGSTPEKSVV